MQNRILLVEDRPGSLNELGDQLRARDIQVIDAFGIEQGLASVQEYQPNLIVFELGAPLADGLTDLQRMSSFCADQHLPVVYTSAHASEQFRSLTREQAAVGLFEEPFGTDCLVMVIQMALAQHQGHGLLG